MPTQKCLPNLWFFPLSYIVLGILDPQPGIEAGPSSESTKSLPLDHKGVPPIFDFYLNCLQWMNYSNLFVFIPTILLFILFV